MAFLLEVHARLCHLVSLELAGVHVPYLVVVRHNKIHHSVHCLASGRKI